MDEEKGVLNLQEIGKRMSELKDWSIDGGDKISKNFELANFKVALYFINKIGEIAEKHNHHPLIINEFNKVRISLTTYYAKGLTEKDFIVAKEIDSIN